MSQLLIIDYGMGNITSVQNAFAFLGENCTVTNKPEALKRAKGIILPGVGAFPAAMQNLNHLGLSDALTEWVVHRKIPFLGICLGMQLIAFDSTERTYSKGLGWIEGNVTQLIAKELYRVPHVGWNEVTPKRQSILFNRIEDKAHFYFDHSYHMQCQSDVILATCDYAGPCVATIEKDNIFAVQFHPEKSQRNGLILLRNFLNSL